MAIKHKFASAKADGADTTLVRPSNWNDDHNHVPFSFVLLSEGSTTQVFTNLAATATELTVPKSRTKADLTYASEARLVVAQGAIGSAGSWLRGQYSTDGGTNWNYLDGATGPEVLIATANQLVASSWVTLAAGAKADVLLRPVAGGGDGVADPAFWRVELQVR